uniref:Sema domain-containing protein n=1 Tax=Syphacia muris TaxID=451379 RepID=A0A0N5AAA3_9BILA
MVGHVFTRGELYYRRLLFDIDSESLYIGAEGHLYRLGAYNINDTATNFASFDLSVSVADEKECRQSGHGECTNGVRLMFLKDQKKSLLVCSSNAMKPQLHELDAFNLLELSPPENVIGICAPDPNINATAVFVEWGNPGDIPAVYSGIRTGFPLDNHLIYRPALIVNKRERYPSLKTVYTDSRWLFEPQFVASFSVKNYVYFFFRELSVEHQFCGPVVYSRVARICKRDIGGKHVLRQVWTSFVKARLNCSIVSQYPLYFDQIQSVYMVERNSETYFYSTLSTADPTFGGSAVCVFTLSSINQVFDHGSFLEQNQSGGSWETTPPENVPSYRPGTCAKNSGEISDGDLNFAKNHLLMADAVSGGSPLFTVSRELLTHVVVDVLEFSNVVFAYSYSLHKTYKIVEWNRNKYVKPKAIASYSLKTASPILAIAIWPKKYIYVSNKDEVLQYNIVQCQLYTTCKHCTDDPYCAWNLARNLCYSKDPEKSFAVGWVVGSVQESNACQDTVLQTTEKVFPGDSIHMQCSSMPNTWKYRDHTLMPSKRVHFTIEGGLILLDVSVGDSGNYECYVGDELIAAYILFVDDVDCKQPTTVAQFKSSYREWCKKLSSYKSNVTKWQKWYEKNVS